MGGVEGLAKVPWAQVPPISQWPLEGSSFPSNTAGPLTSLMSFTKAFALVSPSQNGTRAEGLRGNFRHS